MLLFAMNPMINELHACIFTRNLLRTQLDFLTSMKGMYMYYSGNALTPAMINAQPSGVEVFISVWVWSTNFGYCTVGLLFVTSLVFPAVCNFKRKSRQFFLSVVSVCLKFWWKVFESWLWDCKIVLIPENSNEVSPVKGRWKCWKKWTFVSVLLIWSV